MTIDRGSGAAYAGRSHWNEWVGHEQTSAQRCAKFRVGESYTGLLGDEVEPNTCILAEAAGKSGLKLRVKVLYKIGGFIGARALAVAVEIALKVLEVLVAHESQFIDVDVCTFVVESLNRCRKFNDVLIVGRVIVELAVDLVEKVGNKFHYIRKGGSD